MWTFKEPVKIVLRKERVTITKEALEKNQDLAQIILNDPVYKERYGHNLKEVDNIRIKNRQADTVTEQTTIPVNVKKKAESQSPTLPESASTSTEALSDGMSLNVKESAPQSQSSVLQESKPGTGNRSSQGRR